MQSYQKLLLANKAWAKEKKEIRPNFFKDMAKFQQPEFLWIGCSDSRVPAEEITGSSPGEIFVHRNIANMVVQNDLNLQSVLTYGVEVLKVKHVIVCGHYGCGGVLAAMGPPTMIDPWLKPIRDLVNKMEPSLGVDTNSEIYLRTMVELNLIEQVQNLAQTPIIQKAWQQYGRPILHGWVFNLSEGELKECIMLKPGETHMARELDRKTLLTLSSFHRVNNTNASIADLNQAQKFL